MTSEVLDDFEDTSGWAPVASGLAQLSITPARLDGRAAMRLDFDFRGGGGFVVARKVFSRSMPESFSVSFAIRGAAPPNRLELKLADPSGHNVWWRHWDAFALPDDWHVLHVRSNEIDFAWGPAGGGSIAELGAIELVIAAGPGGEGTLWIADLRLEDRTYRATPRVRASSAVPGHPPESALDPALETSWRSASTDASPWLQVDFGERREIGGLVLWWVAGMQPRAFVVQGSDDAAGWRTIHAAEPASVERSYVYLPGCEYRHLRLALEAASGRGCGLARIAVQAYGFSRSIPEFFEHVARDAPRGWHPRWLAREQSYWTAVGLPDGETCAIVNEEGMVEVDRGSFSIEPFVAVEGRLLTWADAGIAQSLEDDWIPVPTSVWRSDDLTVRTTVFAGRRNGLAVLYLRYRLENAATRARRARLFAAIRPFQVNPPWQAFGELGGMRRIEEMTWDGRAVRVDGSRWVVPLVEPAGFGASAFAAGEIPSHLASGVLPAPRAVRDVFGYASGALAFDLDLPSGGRCDVFLAVPFGSPAPPDTELVAGADGARELAAVLRGWRERLGGVGLHLPAAARDHALVARTAAAQILVNRDGPALQPGPRRYTRSWIRDGAVMAAALLRFGRSAEAVEFVRWYAGYQADEGNVPCCVDRNGPDWLVEHDSHGELVFAIAECFRFTRDHEFLAEMWPAVQRAIGYLDGLRAARLGPEYDAPELSGRRGLLPESASHEGYLAHPVHSYWDDFWALQAYRDAASMAALLGDGDAAKRIASSGEALDAALRASIAATIAERGIAYVPGSVEWADFDPTATAVAVSLLGAVDLLPARALESTFDQYLDGLRRRRSGEIDWNNYSAYEIRIIGALVHLGWRDEAAELADFLLGDRRPRAWNQWPEISWRDPRSPGHIGDVPHTWIGAEYVLAFRDMLAYERAADASLVLFAGIPSSWLESGEPVRAAGLPTHYGNLDIELRCTAPDALEASVGGLRDFPPGGIILRPPLPSALRSVDLADDTTPTFDATSATLTTCPTRATLRT